MSNWPEFSQDALNKIAEEDWGDLDDPSKELVQNIIEHEQGGYNNCPQCKENIDKKGIVCEKHYHDYDLCWNESCMMCILHRSFGLQFEEDTKQLTAEQKALYIKALRALQIRKKNYVLIK